MTNKSLVKNKKSILNNSTEQKHFFLKATFQPKWVQPFSHRAHPTKFYPFRETVPFTMSEEDHTHELSHFHENVFNSCLNSYTWSFWLTTISFIRGISTVRIAIASKSAIDAKLRCFTEELRFFTIRWHCRKEWWCSSVHFFYWSYLHMRIANCKSSNIYSGSFFAWQFDKVIAELGTLTTN